MKTGPDGAWRFDDVRPGLYGLVANHQYYVISSFGQVRFRGTRRLLEVEAGLPRGSIRLLMWKLGWAAGRVLDENDEPVPGRRVTALRQAFYGGVAKFTKAATEETNDRGEYRFAGLEPGNYAFCACVGVANFPAQERPEQGADPANDEGLQQLAAAGGWLPDEVAPEVGGQLVQVDGAHTAARALADGGLEVPASRLHPGVADLAAARLVAIEPSSGADGIDIRVASEPTVPVGGTVVDVNGEPAPRVAVRLVRQDLADGLAYSRGLETALAVTDGGGAFTLHGVPPGAYQAEALVGQNAWVPRMGEPGFWATVSAGAGGLMGTTRPPDPDIYWARTPVVVGDDGASGLRLQLERGLRISGTIAFEGSAAATTERRVSGMNVWLRPLDRDRLGAPAFARVQDGRFESAPHPAGRYEIAISNPSRFWKLARVERNGRDISREVLHLSGADVEDLVVVYTTDEALLTGRIEVAPVDGAGGFTVVLIPADVEGWIRDGMLQRLTATSLVDAAGGYRLGNLLPGSYLVAALDPHMPFDLTDPDFVRSLRSFASPVTVSVGPNGGPVLPVVRR